MFDVHEMEINFGPQHPSTHGVLRVLLKVDGERIIDAKPIIGYLHRGTEKLFENMAYPQCIPHTDRMDYVASATNNLGFVETVEKIMGVTGQIPKRAQIMRVMLSELQRISSHLLWLATHAIDIGAMTPFFYCFREREQVLDLFESYCGARLTLNCMRIGGMPEDLGDGWLDDMEAFVDKFEAAVDEYESLLTNNRIWKRRTVGIGVLSPEEAIEWGITGPPEGEVYHSIESPKGELGYYIVSDGKGQSAYRLRVRPPSFVNLQALPAMAKGHLVSDLVALIGTIDIVLGEVDR